MKSQQPNTELAPRASWLSLMPVLLGSFTTLIGVLVINGWLFDIEILKSLHPSFVSMKTNTAVALTFLGVALTLLGAFPQQRVSRVLASSASLAAVMIGAVSLIQYTVSIDLGLDQLLFRDSVDATETFVPGRMALITCVCFIMSGLALHVIAANYRNIRRLADIFAVLTGLAAIFVLLGYAYDEAALRHFGFPGSMAVHTAIAFLMVASGTLTLNPEERISAPIFTNTPVGIMLRWLLPASVLIPVLVGWLRVAGERAGLYSTGVGVSLSVVMTITLLLAIALIGGTLLDRSQRRMREVERLAGENDQKLRSLLDNSQVAVHIRDRKGHITFANKKFEELFGISSGGWEGKKSADFLPVKLSTLHAFTDEKVLSTGRAYEYEESIDSPLGQRIYLSSKFPMLDGLGTIYALGCVSTDITERKRASDEINKFFELSLNLHCIANQDGYFVKLNPAWEEVLGFTREELTSKQFSDFVHPDDRESTIAQVQRQATGQTVIAFENRYLCRDGSYRTLLWNSTPSADSKLIYATASDITDRKAAEDKIAVLNKALAHRAVALESVNAELEAFSYSVSHDLRAPLRSIDGFSLALLEDFEGKLGTEGDDYLRRVRGATQRMARLIDDMLQLSRVSRGDFNREAVDLSRMALEIVDSLREKHPARSVEFVLQSGMYGEGDQRLLHVAMENLIGNAWKYSSKIEQARIEFGATEVNGSKVFFIRDNGAGFDQNYAGKLFGAFQRLHSAGEFEGTGVGLAIVKRIINRHGGRVWAEGVVDKGATFYFTLETQEIDEGRLTAQGFNSVSV
ncbi:MAG: PAS domain S-box protein [Candidatus Zixiibacteriota bacterium]